MLRSLSNWFRDLASRDFFPEFSKHVRRFFGGTLGVLISAFLLAVVCGLFLHPRVFALAGGIGIVLVLGIFWPWISLRGLRLQLAFDQSRIVEGDRVAVDLTISNHLAWPVHGLILRDGFAGEAVHIEAAKGRTQTRARWDFHPPLRGEYPTAVPHILTSFPFGIWEPRAEVTVTGSIIVWPRTFPVGPVPAQGGQEVLEGNVARHMVGASGDVLGVRPYRRGDSPRRIHWSQSAKHDRLIVCELQTNTRPVVLIVLDGDPAIHSAGGNGSLEWSIRIAASLARGWLDAGAQVGFVAGGDVIRPASGALQKTRILDALARTPAQPQRSLRDTLQLTDVRAVSLRILITTDHRSIHDRGRENKVALLIRDGFPDAQPDDAGRTIGDEGAAWITFRNPESVPQQLREGWSEARHGS